MRLIIITQGVSRIVEPLLSSGHEVIGILEAAPRARKSTDYDRALAWLPWLRSSPLQSFCAKREIDYRFLSSCADEGLKEWISGRRCDLIVVFGMSALLTHDVYSLPRYGTINLHTSMLPAYRGPNPDFWQYHDMELNPGVTVHYIDEGEDTGPVLAQQRVTVEPGMKSPDRLDRLVGEVGVQLLLKTIARIESGRATATPQPELSPTPRARNLRSAEHATIIDWQTWPVQRVWNLLRGTESWLNALPAPRGIFTGLRWSIEGFDSVVVGGPPGRLGRSGFRRYVACRDGRIFITCRTTLTMIVKIKAKSLLLHILLRKKSR